MSSARVLEGIEELMRGLVAGTVEPEDEAPAEAAEWIEDLLSQADTYRDAALMVLAFAVDAGTAEEIAVPPAGRRTVAQKFAELCDELNIRARRDAFQTLAKGSSTLLGRDRESWNRLLEWGRSLDSVEPLDQAMRYMAARICSTARDLPAMPPLDVRRLTFQRVVRIIEDLLDVSSGGAHEQFVFAALLDAVGEELGGLRTQTKTLSAADASAGTAADVQLLEGGRVREAYEVTANPWVTKIPQAAAVLRQHDLPRAHIVAPGPAPRGDEIKEAVAGAALTAGLVAVDIDLSVLDVSAECRSLAHRLSRPGRRAALNKLWEHLAMRQPDDALVRAYVDKLHTAGVTTAP